MTANPLEEAMRRVLNDRRIFRMPQELIGPTQWSQMRNTLSHSDKSTAFSIIAAAQQQLAEKIRAERDPKKKGHLENARQLLHGLEGHIKQDTTVARQILLQLDSFGPLVCNFSKNELEDFGRVIEGHSPPMVKQFFLYKIQKDQRQRQALSALFEEVERLYDQHVEPLEIAFFVRKIDSLTQIVEVLKS